MNDELIQFTRDALARNIARPQIAGALAKAGWGASEIGSALAAFAEVDFPMPVPRPRPYLSAREVFVYVVMFASLFDVCYNVGSLLFDFINKAFPDPVQAAWGVYYRESMRWSVAHLSIALPLFFFTFHSVSKAIAANPVLRNSKPRKWLTYLTLMVATLSLTCDVGTLVYNVLAGELTARFLLKVGVVAVIAGSVFLYFLADMRKEEKI